jgi:hypothetical protein
MTVTAPGSQASCKSRKQGRRIGIFGHNAEKRSTGDCFSGRPDVGCQERPAWTSTDKLRGISEMYLPHPQGRRVYIIMSRKLKMKPPVNRNHNSSSSNKTKIIIVAVLLGLGILVLITLLGFMFLRNGFQLAAPATQTQVVPTPQCIEPTLTLGTAILHVKTVPNNSNAFPPIPQDTPDTAYWVEGTTINYVFGLSPIGNNLILNTSLKAGDPAVINWADCSKDEYVINSIDMAQPNDLNIFNQSAGGITVYVRTDASNLVIRGERPIIQSAETPLPTDVNAIQLDIQFSDLTPPDNNSVKIGLNITNRGAQTVTLTNNDISLTVENGPQVFPLAVEPALPQDIQPNGMITLAITFPKPGVNSAVLRILDTTVDYYFQ